MEKNIHNFSWSNIRLNQKEILKSLGKGRSIIFKDLNEHAFNFICKNNTDLENSFEVYTIPDNWLVGEFKLKK